MEVFWITYTTRLFIYLYHRSPRVYKVDECLTFYMAHKPQSFIWPTIFKHSGSMCNALELSIKRVQDNHAKLLYFKFEKMQFIGNNVKETSSKFRIHWCNFHFYTQTKTFIKVHLNRSRISCSYSRLCM